MYITYNVSQKSLNALSNRRFFERFLGKGGDFTLFITGKKPRPDTEPMHSGGNRNEFPITTGYDSAEYDDLIDSHITKYDENILLCQSFHNGCFSGCFASSERYSPRPSVCAGICDYDSFLQAIDSTKKWAKQIYSFAFYESGKIGCFVMKNYGTDQKIVTNVNDLDELLEDGYKITACAAWDSTFYIVMTKGTKEYRFKRQVYFTRTSWDMADIEMVDWYEEGYTITDICYSTGRGKYFVVLTKTSQKQKCMWFEMSETTTRDEWIDAQNEKGYCPTIIFNDVTDDQTLVVMTKDKNISGCSCRFNQKVTD